MRINSLSFVEEQIDIKKLTKVETRNFVETINEMILTGQSNNTQTTRSLRRAETSCGLFPAIVLRYLIRTERKRLFSGLVCSTPF